MYRSLDAVVVRIAVCRPGQLPPWPDLTSTAGATSWRPWLAQVIQVPEFVVALQQASPALTARIGAICGTAHVTERDTRRVVLATMRYLLRATGRATPYGLFAGVAPARTGRVGALRLGRPHRPIARLDARWVQEVLDHLETHPEIRPHATVRANNLLVERGEHIVLEHRASSTPAGAPTHVLVRATVPLRSALALASDPIRWRDLATKLAVDFDGDPHAVETMLAQLVRQRLLLTNLHPPMTSTDPLAWILAATEQLLADADSTPVGNLDGAYAVLAQLRDALQQKATHDRSAPSAAPDLRQKLTASVAVPRSAKERVVGVDLRMDCDLTVPQIVAEEAATAAAVLVRLGRPVGGGWTGWHRRFLERYGPHAVVPVFDVVNADVGLGYPAGFQGGPGAPTPSLTDRDRTLLGLAQQAALTRQTEIQVENATLIDLGQDETGAIQPSTELTVRVHAPSMAAIEQGDFRLAIVAVSRHAGTTTGRFLDMFDPADQHRMREAYATAPSISRDALRAQVTAATRYTVTADVARAPHVLPYLLPVGEYHDNDRQPHHLDLNDIAVTADVHRIYLVSMSRCRVVEPVVLNAVEPVHHTLPIVRFLTEAPNALGKACAIFDWGAAADLPFLPAIRHGRTILSPARWRLSAAELPGPGAAWPQWSAALTRWRDQRLCPEAVFLGDGDQRIRLDLTEPAHCALLRDQFTRVDAVLLRAAPSPDVDGWFDGHPQEVVIPLAATTDPVTAPRLPEDLRPVAVRGHGHLPGEDGRLYLKLYGHPNRQNTLLTEFLPRLLAQLGAAGQWWFLRYADPEPHLRIRLLCPNTTGVVAEWVAGLRQAGLIARVQFDTDFPETARFGGSNALAAAEKVFAADSAAALAQLDATRHRHGPASLSITAASLFDLATGLLGDPNEAMAWLIAHTRAHRPAPERAVYDHAIALAHPHDDTALRQVPGGEQILTCWHQRRTAVAHYRDALHTATIDRATLLPDLLHLHHARMLGIDLDSERACLHLTRAASLSWTTRARSRA